MKWLLKAILFVFICVGLLYILNWQINDSEIPVTTVTENSNLTGWSCEWINSTPVEINEPEIFLSGGATRYDYDLDIPNGSWWSKRHDTCAMRAGTRYNYYKVCLRDSDRCVVCYLNDYWPKAYTYKVIDLSSHAFSQLADLKRGVILVDIYEIWPEY